MVPSLRRVSRRTFFSSLAGDASVVLQVSRSKVPQMQLVVPSYLQAKRGCGGIIGSLRERGRPSSGPAVARAAHRRVPTLTMCRQTKRSRLRLLPRWPLRGTRSRSEARRAPRAHGRREGFAKHATRRTHTHTHTPYIRVPLLLANCRRAARVRCGARVCSSSVITPGPACRAASCGAIRVWPLAPRSSEAFLEWAKHDPTLICRLPFQASRRICPCANTCKP